MKMPLYLLDSGMEFKVKKEKFTFIGRSDNGKIEAYDKFGLIVEFPSEKAVLV